MHEHRKEINFYAGHKWTVRNYQREIQAVFTGNIAEGVRILKNEII